MKIPVSIKSALVIVSSFTFAFFTLLGLGKVVLWWAEGSLNSSTVSMIFVFVSLILSAIFAVICTTMYCESPKFKAEVHREQSHATYLQRKDDMQQSFDLRRFEDMLADARKLPPAEREITISRQIGD